MLIFTPATSWPSEDDRLGLLDFGAIGVIDAETRQLLATLLGYLLMTTTFPPPPH